ncbi:MAG TPA: hypothetical protein VKB26_01390 [Candidatus Acidoferrales bacterium]|nr:hypothetical protein [Candidatus Acidoferrales bacterium]
MTLRVEQRALVTRDAYAALRDLKKLVDRATEEIHAAELETVRVAIGRAKEDSPLRTLMGAVETLRSPKFDAAIQQARQKMETAVAWYQPGDKAATSSS